MSPQTPAGDLAAAEAAVRARPSDAGLWIGYGLALAQAGKADRALGAFEQATTLDPRSAEAQYNCGIILFQRGDIAAACERYEAAVEAKPDFLLARSNHGIALEVLGQTDAARAVFDQAILSHPNAADPYWNKALLALRNGDFTEGWRCFEWRWSTGRLGSPMFAPGKTLWLGGVPIAGRTILLHEEQGLGDMIQFARFVADVQALGARVILRTFPPLKALFEGQFDAEVFATGDELPTFDHHCPMMSLPLALGQFEETLYTRGAYLSPPQDRVAKWRDALPRDRRRRIGLVWKGNPLHEGDNARSLRLSQMIEMLGEDDDLISLQREATPAERALLNARGIRHLGEDLVDFADTAAVIADCDLVICVDTAVAHLTGALGKPLWLLLPARSDWRWRLSGDASAWYPSARLFRGTRQSEWDDVVGEVRAALATPPAPSPRRVRR